MSDRNAISVGGIIDTIGKLWMPVLGVLFLVVWWTNTNDHGSATDSRITGLQASITQLQSDDQDLSKHVQTLDDDRANDQQNSTNQYQAIEAQLQASETKEDGFDNKLSEIGQDVSGMSAQVNILLNRTLPGPSSGQSK